MKTGNVARHGFRMRPVAAALGFALAAGVARAADPFVVTAQLERAGEAWQVKVTADMPPHHLLYADRFAVALDGRAATGVIAPAPVLKHDPLLEEDARVYTSRVSAVYALACDPAAAPVRAQVAYQGCSDVVCFLPRTLEFLLSPGGATVVPAVPEHATVARGGWLDGLEIKASAAGYLNAQDFRAFLARGHGEAPPPRERGIRAFAVAPAAFLKEQGLFWTLLLVLLGGLLLNLTPCVLPMIPINLAIIGAGAQAGSRRRGFLLGAAYGAGMALVYGALGLLVVLTGTVFGAIQSSPWFNAGIALLFVALGLALLDVIPLDLSRFQKSGGTRGGFVAAVVAGGIAALLAGACVAPVVAAVLLLAGTLYQGGTTVAVLLPFMLGVGMALPWPLAGAGLSVLPKPGAWMVWVKQGFAVLIFAMAFYYGWLAYGGFGPTPATKDAGSLVAGDTEGWRAKVAEAKAAGKPLFLDFHASWCKNCHVMDRTTFRDPQVVQELKRYVVVRVATEHPAVEPERGMAQAFGVSGLPTYVVVAAAGR